MLENTLRLARISALANHHLLLRAFVATVIVVHGNLALYAQAIAGEGKTSVAAVGTVLDGEGSPIEDAVVSIRMRIPRSEKPIQLFTKTKADGSYSISEVPAKTDSPVVSIRAYAAGFEIAQTNVTATDNTLDNLLTNGSLVANFKLHKSDKRSIKLVNTEGKPVVGARLVSLTAKSPFQQQVYVGDSDWKHFGLDAPQSDEQGVVEVPGLGLSTKYNFQFEHPDYARTPSWNTDLTRGIPKIPMDRGIAVEFLVSCESDPKAVAEAVVKIAISEELGHQFIEVPVNASGKANIRLRDRSATITIEHPTLQSSNWYFYGKERSLSFALHRTGTVKGRVVNAETGEGAQGVSVQLATENRVVKNGYSDEQGYYQAVIAEGIYSAKLSNYGADWKATDQEEDVTVKAGEDVTVPDFSVSPKPPIQGQVFLPSGEPAANAIIVANFRDEPVLADAEGKFALRSRDNSGRIPIHAWHPRQGFSKVVAFTPDDAKDFRIELQAEGSAVGAVKDENGNVVPNLKVNLEVFLNHQGVGTSTNLRSTFTRNDGTFRFSGLSSGYEYRILVQGKSRTDWSDQPNVANAAFTIDGKARPERRVHTVGEKMLAEAREIGKKYDFAPRGFIPLAPVKLAYGNASDCARKPDRLLFLCFGNTLHNLTICELAHRLYGDSKVQVIAIAKPWGKEGRLEEGKVDFPVAIDSISDSIFARYHVSEQEAYLIYDRGGKLIHASLQFDNPLIALRNAVLYGE